MSTLDKSLVFRKFKVVLAQKKGPEEAARIWQAAGERFAALTAEHPDLERDERLLILPAAAMYQACPDTLPLMREYAANLGRKIGGVVHAITCVPGVPGLLWKNMPSLMRRMSSPEKGYSRQIISETAELVGVDIYVCPLHQAAAVLGAPEVASVVCAMDKAYMTGFRHIEYTRNTAIGEGGERCDYRLRFDRNKK